MQTRDELELLLVGMAMHTKSRDDVLSMIPEGFLSARAESLVRGFRDPKRAAELMDWLGERGARPEKGELCVEAVLRQIRNCNQQHQIKMISTKIKSACSLGTPDQVISALEKCLAVAKEFDRESDCEVAKPKAVAKRKNASHAKSKARA